MDEEKIRWCIYDSHGDIWFKSERLDFHSFDEMIEHIKNDEDLLERIEGNWAIMYPGRYKVSMATRFMTCSIIETLLQMEEEKCLNTKE